MAITNWAVIMTAEQLDKMWGADNAARRWWESRTLPQLRGELSAAWDCGQMEKYVIARSYIAIRAEEERRAAA